MSLFQSKSLIVAIIATTAATIFGAFFRETIPPVVTSIMDYYFPRKEQSRQDAPAININMPSVPSAFQVNYLYREAESSPLKPILPGSILHSGDHYKIVFTSDRNGYVYLFQVDSTGQFFQLFPMAEFKGVRVDNHNPVKAGQRYVLPAEDKSFKLDRVVGRERLFLAVTTHAHGELETLAQRLTVARQRKDAPAITQLNQALAARLEGRDGEYFYRGLESVETDQVLQVAWNQTGEVFDTLGRSLENLCENCVYGMEFEHR